MENKVAILCVLKSGGPYHVSHVVRLKEMLERHVSIPFSFYCLTDHTEIDLFPVIRLRQEWRGWWSKIELFRKGIVKEERIVYFDLDTVIVNNIDDLILQDKLFIGLKPFNPTNRKINGYVASAIMSWRNGTLHFIYNQFDYRKHRDKYRGDQDYISVVLGHYDIPIKYWQNLTSGIYSYKRDICKGRHCPDARIICFHGRPRLEKEHVKKLRELYEDTSRK